MMKSNCEYYAYHYCHHYFTFVGVYNIVNDCLSVRESVCQSVCISQEPHNQTS